ncbi:lactonase family protein [Sphingomonas sp. PAMC 26621]|uniref:lactonase family protein n=1 Tax=Sphingomonas sp. PAMC 26621 TaxID=1112213 RepID=UPI0023787DD4|nr:beta-propeller fold lactonase family protein [Sphingomonas sp. PAMC 26621]
MTGPLCTISLAAGTYRGGGGRGLCTLERDTAGTWRIGPAYTAAPNASFSVFSPRHRLHYIVEEDAIGRVGVHRHGDQGWETLAVVPAGGGAPCHIAVDPEGTLLAVANYAGGSVALIRLDPDTGLPRGEPQVHANQGSGPNAVRQDAPHAHWVGFSPDRRWLYQTDLGTDHLLAFDIAADDTLGTPRVAFAAPPGSGPRHLLLHPRHVHRAYLASELANT